MLYGDKLIVIKIDIMRVFNVVYLSHFHVIVCVIGNLSLFAHKCDKKPANHRTSGVSMKFFEYQESIV